jgi:uncharacterized membrane protein
VEAARPVPKFSIADTITYSWNAAFRNFASVMLVSAVVFVGNILVVLISSVNGDAGLNLAFQLLGVLVDLLLVLGLVRASLDVVQGRTPTLAEVFRPDGYGPYIIASILFLVGVWLGIVLLVVPGIIFAIIFQFYGYVVAEHPDVPATVALQRSAQITRGVRIRLFGLSVVLVLLNLAGAMLCFVGLIVTYAVTGIALAYVYRLLTGQPVATL